MSTTMSNGTCNVKSLNETRPYVEAGVEVAYVSHEGALVYGTSTGSWTDMFGVKRVGVIKQDGTFASPAIERVAVL